LDESNVEDTKPQNSLHRKAISARFQQNPDTAKASSIPVFCAGIALKCGAGLGSVAQWSGAGTVPPQPGNQNYGTY